MDTSKIRNIGIMAHPPSLAAGEQKADVPPKRNTEGAKADARSWGELRRDGQTPATAGE